MASIALMSAIHSLDTHTLLAPFTHLELRTILFTLAVVCLILVLAYLTNPSETSFRTFLTEQAFRHHLSSLDDADAEDAQDELEAATSAAVSSHAAEMLTKRAFSGSFSKHRSLSSYASPPFAFANRASVSLRTPKHMFRSFGIFSVAAVVPASTSASLAARSRRIGNAQHSQTHQPHDTDEDGQHDRSDTAPSILWESWFVGAFGMWFWAVNLDGLWHESGFGTRDESDGTVTGVLDMKALDRSDSLTHLSFTSSGNGHTNNTKRSAPKLRSREHLTSQAGTALSRRSQTPPPLPKSASLPLHSKRSSTQSSATSDKSSHNGHIHNIGSAYQSAKSQQPQQASLILPSLSGHLHHSSGTADTQEARLVASISLPSHGSSCCIPPGASASVSRSPSTLFASSPVIADIFRQITASQTALNDLHTQLSDFHSLASTTRPVLDDELEKQRERKRSDDTARQELKVQLKALDDQKRSAEATRRDADKRLKQARAESDACEFRTTKYANEIREFAAQMEAQEAKIVESGVKTGALVVELGSQLEARRAELKEVEEDVAQLALRARDIEEKIGEEEKRLERALENAKQRKRASAARRSPTYRDSASSALSFGDLQPTVHILTRRTDADAPVSPRDTSALVSSPLTAVPMESSLSAATTKPAPFVPPPLQTAPSSAAISIGRKLNFDAQYTRDTTHTFSPFGNELGSPGLLSPTGERLLPSSLYESLIMSNDESNSPGSPVSPLGSSAMNMDVSRSFQSEDDLVLDRNWMNQRQLTGSHTMPVSPAGSTTEVNKFDAEMGFNGNGNGVGRERMNSLGSRGSHNSSSPMGSNESASFHPFANMGFPLSQTQSHDSAQHATRKTGWFGHHSTKTNHEKKASNDKKGLNPDAKEFSLSKEKQSSFSAFLHRSRERNGHATSNSGSDSRTSSTPSSASISTPDISAQSVYIDAASPMSAAVSKPFTNTNSGIGPPPTTAMAAMTHGSTPSQTLTNSPFGGFGFGLGASSWFGGSRAFEPTPLEREQFSLALGSKGNSSLDRLDHFPSSSAVSPARVTASPAAATAPAPAARAWGKFGFGGHGQAPRVGNGHAQNGTTTTSFSPFDDEDPLPSAPFSASSH